MHTIVMLKKSVMNIIVMLEKMGICDTHHGYVKNVMVTCDTHHGDVIKSWLYVMYIMVRLKK